MRIVPALIIRPSEVLLKLSSRPPVAKRAAVVPSQATDDPACRAREEEGGWNRGRRRPLGPGITLAPAQAGWREEELREHICLWMSRHWPYVFGTSNGILAQVPQVEDKCLGFTAHKHRGRWTRHHVGTTQQMDLCQSHKQWLEIKLRGAIKRWETGDTHSRDTHLLLLFNHSRVQRQSLWPSASLSTSIFNRQEEPRENRADGHCSLTAGASICSWWRHALYRPTNSKSVRDVPRERIAGMPVWWNPAGWNNSHMEDWWRKLLKGPSHPRPPFDNRSQCKADLAIKRAITHWLKINKPDKGFTGQRVRACKLSGILAMLKVGGGHKKLFSLLGKKRPAVIFHAYLYHEKCRRKCRSEVTSTSIIFPCAITYIHEYRCTGSFTLCLSFLSRDTHCKRSYSKGNSREY